MNRIGVLLFALLFGGGVCLLLALGHAVITTFCRVCRPFEEWRGIELQEEEE